MRRTLALDGQWNFTDGELCCVCVLVSETFQSKPSFLMGKPHSGAYLEMDRGPMYHAASGQCARGDDFEVHTCMGKFAVASTVVCIAGYATYYYGWLMQDSLIFGQIAGVSWGARAATTSFLQDHPITGVSG